MSAFIANAIVYLLVVLSAAYAIWHLGPASLRQRLGLSLQRRFPVLLRNLPLSAGGCGSSCGGCGLAAKRGGAKPAARSAEARVDTRIPLRGRHSK